MLGSPSTDPCLLWCIFSEGGYCFRNIFAECRKERVFPTGLGSSIFQGSPREKPPGCPGTNYRDAKCAQECALTARPRGVPQRHPDAQIVFWRMEGRARKHRGRSTFVLTRPFSTRR